MQVELDFTGEYVNVQMSVRQADLLHSYLEYHTRNKSDEVEELEHDVAEKLCDEIRPYIPDDLPSNEDAAIVEALLNAYESCN